MEGVTTMTNGGIPVNHSLRLRLAAMGVLAAFAVVFVLSGVGIASAQARTNAPTKGGPVSLPLTGSGTAHVPGSTTLQNVTFQGTMDVERFTSSGHDVWAVGTVSGTIYDTAGNAIASVPSTPETLQVQRGDPTCPILNLVLGPLHLNLLGLVVDLNQVILTITAVSGAGNLLGNLLCAVANLLNGSASGNAIATLLNNILGILSGLGL